MLGLRTLQQTVFWRLKLASIVWPVPASFQDPGVGPALCWVSVLNKPMQLCSYTFVVSAGRGVSSTLSHAGSAAPSATTSWEGCLAARRRSHTEASSSAVATIDSQSPHYLVRSQQELVGLRRQHAAQRMRNRYKKLNPLERAAAIAHEDLVANSSLGPSNGSDASEVLPPSLPPDVAARLLGPSVADALLQPQQTTRPVPVNTALAAPGRQATPPKRSPGVLQSVPVVSPSNEHLASALKRASRVTHNTSIKNEAERERNRAARQMDTLMKELSVPLSKYTSSFPDPAKLHPFDAALLQLTVNTGMYKSTLSKVSSLRKSLQEVGKAYANRAANAPNKAGALAVALEGCQELERVYRSSARAVDELKEVAKKLRSLPVLDVSLPTLALVGAPNVGKSSLVKVLSSGTPEVCNYPFTTRSIKMGHFYLDGRKHQVTDTPGLLARPDDQRNKMELLTLAALACLPTSVLFVTDLTEECGTSVADQWAIRCEVRRRFPDKDWIDAFSKADVLAEVLQSRAPPATEQSGDTSSSQLPASSAQQQQEQDGVVCGQDVVARLPHALSVSSLTQQGISELQASIVSMFSKQSLDRAAALASANMAGLPVVTEARVPRLPTIL